MVAAMGTMAPGFASLNRGYAGAGPGMTKIDAMEPLAVPKPGHAGSPG